MLFLSAQPDNFYYLWQIKLQLFNFSQLGIPKESIHVLIGYNPKSDLSSDFKNLITENKDALFFPYPDNRSSKKYTVSLRPHIIAQHLRTFEALNYKPIFFHDADIIFKTPPIFDELLNDDVWYASDTRSYLNFKYIQEAAGEEVFVKMCDIMDVTPELIRANDNDAGGAQFIFKNSDYEFWEMIETGCEQMFELLSFHNSQLNFPPFDDSVKLIQSWCSEMWVLWWGALKIGKTFRIHKSLDFCWAGSNIKEWEDCNTLHYTGSSDIDDKKVFSKGKYLNHDPFYEDFTLVDSGICSYPLAKWINKFVEHEKTKRINLTDVTFLIEVKINNREQIKNLFLTLNFLDRHIKSHFIINEISDRPYIDQSLLPAYVKYNYLSSVDRIDISTCYNEMMKDVETEYLAIYNIETIIPIQNIVDAITILRKGVQNLVFHHKEYHYLLDSITKDIFNKFPEDEFLELNTGKFYKSENAFFFGPFFVRNKSIDFKMLKKSGLLHENNSNFQIIENIKTLNPATVGLEGNLYKLQLAVDDNN